MLNWQLSKLRELDALAAFDLFKLRQDVFILEQTCLYPDIDNLDQCAWHLLGRAEDGALAACLRVIPPSGKYRGPALGRLATSAAHRRCGYGQALLKEGIERARGLFPAQGIYLAAQTYLLGFYQAFGFHEVGEPYLEDGIEHIEMVRPPTATQL
ncbi:MAG: GNAT family N-acetyltransferase [Gammaproteobacteria bacterium]|nr:GNAT family N-acetyltransferase [Gammaproteobacteria bacterium]